MEQQTISIAKAGITTTLNSRCSVLAAANSVFGRWDDTKAEENIDFMPTILSRFDTIFIVKDEHDERRDITLAKHVMQVHMNAAADSAVEGELSLDFMKKYIAYCRYVFLIAGLFYVSMLEFSGLVAALDSSKLPQRS